MCASLYSIVRGMSLALLYIVNHIANYKQRYHLDAVAENRATAIENHGFGLVPIANVCVRAFDAPKVDKRSCLDD